MPRYSALSIALHWLSALVIFAALLLGLSLEDMPLSPAKISRINWHKWLGITALCLTTLRLIWLYIHPAPPAPPYLKTWEIRLAKSVKHLLYLELLLLPMSGWLMSSAKGFSVVYLGLIPLPDLVAKNPALAETLSEVHESLAWILILLLILHIAGAVKHSLIDRRPVLYRMGVGRPPQS